MSIYQEILNWSSNKQPFVQDALRRIITSTNLTQNDINELIQLVKKDCGDSTITLNAIPIDNNHIPTTIEVSEDYPRLIKLSNPTNICALYEHGNLTFSANGLSVVYGKNGSGKSSYSRILRKLCWSRNPSITLKKNVFNQSEIYQKADITIETSASNIDFTWTEDRPSNPILKSIFVFDNDCGETYINSENPMEYKPVGIDVFDKLISVFGQISNELDLSITSCTTLKPTLPEHLNSTSYAHWYRTIESLEREYIESQVQFSTIDLERKQDITTLISNENANQNIENLMNMRLRINNYFRQVTNIEIFFNDESISELKDISLNYARILQAYEIASIDIDSLNTLDGFGTNPWRTLWESARSFAHSSNLTDGINFPSQESLNKCVLCQQDLDELAKQRLINFNQFVLNDISSKLSSIESIILKKKEEYRTLTIPSFEDLSELEQIIPNFKDLYNQFEISVKEIKDYIVTLLTNHNEVNITLEKLSPFIMELFPQIDREIEKNNLLLENKNELVAELNELNAKEFLFSNKTTILQYYDEFKYKAWINHCKSQLNTTGISRKIGELMENQAINIQHQEFISHLSFFNRELASKVQISRTRTRQGNTYQRCSLNNINESLNIVLSEGEQKIVAISNFLSECTIDNRLNSMVFDDPVTSLDMDYRELIATKIVGLSANRQIIVFTHDLSFLRLLIDTHKDVITTDCCVIGIDKYNGATGIVSDEIPFLAKNIQERINSIRTIINEHDALSITDVHGREVKLDSARKRFRMLLERSVEEILSNKTYERFNKNIHLKKGNLSSYIITEQTDVDFLLNLFSKYSITEHDGGTYTIPMLPSKNDIQQDLGDYSTWKDEFKRRLKTFQDSYN